MITLANGYKEDSYINLREYIQDTPKSSSESLQEDYPPIHMNHSKEPEVSKIVDNPDGMIDDPLLERRLDLGTTVKKTMGNKFHTFTLDEIKILYWP